MTNLSKLTPEDQRTVLLMAAALKEEALEASIRHTADRFIWTAEADDNSSLVRVARRFDPMSEADLLSQARTLEEHAAFCTKQADERERMPEMTRDLSRADKADRPLYEAERERIQAEIDSLREQATDHTNRAAAAVKEAKELHDSVFEIEIDATLVVLSLEEKPKRGRKTLKANDPGGD